MVIAGRVGGQDAHAGRNRLDDAAIDLLSGRDDQYGGSVATADQLLGVDRKVQFSEVCGPAACDQIADRREQRRDDTDFSLVRHGKVLLHR